ncbi:MAG: AmmeMemoRadiSam system protein A [Thermoanaerobacteraceae bacterium]|nr:AmmeMemoRadiSam system protein A [Thermoanaerobacteraceae bacterium]
MGKLLSAYLMPHPPIIVPEVGHGEEKKIQKTIEALNLASKNIRELMPDTIIVISPHSYVFRDAVSIIMRSDLEGDLGKFAAGEVKFSFKNNIGLSKKILEKAKAHNIPIAAIDEAILRKYSLPEDVDHGTLVPLYFVTKQYNDFKLVNLAYGFLPFEQLYEFGIAINEAIIESDNKVVFIASGDLSHKLTPNSPNGYTPNGKVFDELILNLLKDMKVKEIVNMDKALIEDAAECGFRSICVLLGVLDAYEVKAKVLSHEGPFGVGYGVAEFIPEKEKSFGFMKILYNLKKERINETRANEDIYVKLARKSLEYYLKNNKIMKVPEDLPMEMLNKKAGVFVSIHKDGDLRGCIGTIYPQRDNIADEIIRNAISAGTEDPRFYPVGLEELDDLEYSVDVLTQPESVLSIDELDPKKYGIIVKSGYRSGVLLPDLEGVNSVDEQISIALKKAGINPQEPYSILKFKVVRHK